MACGKMWSVELMLLSPLQVGLRKELSRWHLPTLSSLL